jgi:hypothetical protein
MLEASRSFADWADGLSRTQGFADFMAYLERTGPQVGDALSSIANALLQVLEAASPLGGPALKAITAFADAIAAIADSDLGTPIFAAIAAWRAYSMAVGLAEKAQMRFNASSAAGGMAGAKGGMFSGYTASLLGVTSAQERAQTAAGKTSATISEQRRAFVQGAAGAALLGVTMTGVADDIGLTNTATLALVGTMVAPGIGTALGAMAGGFLDIKAAGDPLTDTLTRLNQAAAQGNWEQVASGIKSVRDQIDDLKHSTGIGDTLSDVGKTIGGVLHGDIGFGFGGPRASGKTADAIAGAETRQVTAGRNAGALAAAQQQQAAAKLAAQGFHLTAAGAREAAMSVDEFAASMRGATAALERQGNWDSFRGAVLDAKDAIAETGKTLTRNGGLIRGQGRDMQRMGLQSRAALRGIASSAIQTAEGMKNVANRTKFLQGARQQFIALARGMGLSKAAAKALADQLGLTGRINAKPKITLQGADASIAKARAVRAAIAAVQSKSVTITTIVRRRAGAPMGITAQAEGGTVEGQRAPYGDKVLTYLAPGEEVISNRHGQADRHRELLKRINANMLADGGTVQRLAGGGTVSGRHDREIARAHKAHASAVKASTKAIQKEKAAREKLVGKRNDLSGSVRDSFLSDPFSTDNVWAAGAGDPRSILKADIAKANAFKRQLAILKHKGLNGDALAAVAATGDVGKAASLASMSGAQVRSYESLYKQRAAAAASVGKYAGTAAYGAQIAQINHKLAQLVHATHQGNHDRRNTGRDVGREINRSAAHAGRNRR